EAEVDRLDAEGLVNRGRSAVPLQQAGHGPRLRRGQRYRVVEHQDEPRREGVLRRPREALPEGARSLGQRPLLGGAPDPPGGHREGRHGPEAIREYIASSEHATIIGPVRFKGSEIQFPGTVSQWVGGDFEVVWPANRATTKLSIPKPAWK